MGSHKLDRYSSLIALATLVLAICLQAKAIAAISGTISYYVWGSAVSDDIDRAVIAAFNKKHPDIKVNLINSGSYGAHLDKLYTMIAGGSPPEVALVDGYDYASLVKHGVATDLTEWAARDGIRAEAYHPSFWQEMIIGGRLYSVASMRGGRVIMYYNEELFEQAGLANPYAAGRWDWDYLVQAGKRLTRDTNGDGIPDRWGFVPYTGGFWPWVWMNGGRLLDEAKTKAPFDEPATYEAIQWLADLRLQHQIVGGDFLKGTVGMYVAWDTEAIATYRRQCTFRWDIAPLPAGPVTQVTTSKGNEVVIPYNASQKNAAWELVKFLGGSDAQYLYAQLGRFVPAQLEAARRMIRDAQAVNAQPAHLNIIAELDTRMLPVIPGFTNLQQMWNQELQAVWAGRTSAREAGEKIAQLSKAILQEAGK